MEMGRTPAAMSRLCTSHGEGPTVTPSHVAADEDGAQLGVGDIDAQVIGGAVARFLDREVGPAQRGAGGGRDLASQADDAQGVAAVGLDVDVEHDVAGHLGHVHAQLASPRAG